MIALRRRTLWERLLRIVPAVRRKQDTKLKAAIKRLMDDPELPCAIEGTIIPNGWGGYDRR
jgi:hypothetical protein